MIERIGLDNVGTLSVSTVAPYCMAWYGKYETGVFLPDKNSWRIAEGYATEEEARSGHEKYKNMTEEQLKELEWIG